MKKLKRFIIYLRLWFIRKIGYTLPSLREATSVIPGEFYDLFGRIVRAVPNKESSTPHVEGNLEHEEVPDHCHNCDLFKEHIPCSFNHRMPNGCDICDNHHFEIICINRGNI